MGCGDLFIVLGQFNILTKVGLQLFYTFEPLYEASVHFFFHVLSHLILAVQGVGFGLGRV